MAPRIGIVTVSDTRTPADDLSGPAVRDALIELGYQDFEIRIVPDEIEQIQAALYEFCGSCQAIFTTGGTGFAPRDVTPEATAPLLDKRADGLCELMRAEGLKQTKFSYLSRGIAGVKGETLIVNLPGSPKAVRDGLKAIGHLIGPIIENLTEGRCPAHHEC